MLTGAPVQSAILMSGSLFLSPPLPRALGDKLIERLEDAVRKDEGKSLRTAAASALIRAVEACGIKSMWLQDEPDFHGWQDRSEVVQSLMIGDVEYEVRISKQSEIPQDMLTS